MARAVVLGGGISGLSSAFYALQEGVPAKFAKVTLLEASERFGGWLHSNKYKDGTVFDYGPRSFRPQGVSGLNTIDLALKLGLRDDIIIAKKGDILDNRYIYSDMTLHELNIGVNKLFKVIPPMKKRLISYILQDIRAAKGKEDESVHSFVSRRYGTDAADFLANPMLRGIYAGDVKKLSIRSTLSILYEMEQRKGRTLTTKYPKSPSVHKALEDYVKDWSIWSLRAGCQQLSDALVEYLSRPDMPTELHQNTPCRKLTFKDGTAVVTTDEGEITADHVFSSIYSGDLAKILPDEHGELAEELQGIPAVSVVVVNLEYPVESPVKGFGHLLPSSEDGPVLGVVYNSCVFPEQDRHKANGKISRFTVMLGGEWYDDLLERLDGSLNPNGIARLAIDVISDQLNITEKPLKVDVIIQNDCIPQYLVGHGERLERIFKYIKDKKLPLSLVGSSYKGVSVNDCIYNSKLAAERLTGLPPYIAPDIPQKHFVR